MKFNRLIIAFAVIAITGLMNSCEDEIDIVNPPPSIVIEENCSYNFTELVVDTNELPPVAGASGQQLYLYEGYEILDMAFNPNNSNQLAIILRSYVHGALVEGIHIIVYNLCSGSETAIYSGTYGSLNIRNIDWSLNNVILFEVSSFPATISSIQPNGDNLTEIPFQTQIITHLKWAYGSDSFIVNGSFIPPTLVNIDGSVISDNLGFTGSYSFVSDSVLVISDYSEVSLYNLNSGITETIDNTGISFSNTIAYSSKLEAAFWTSDTLVALTDIGNGNRTELTNGFIPTRRFRSATASKNGYLAYIADVISPTLSTGGNLYIRTEIRFINPDGTDERRLVLDFE